MYNIRHLLLLALCLGAVIAQESDQCYDPINNGDLTTDYFVQPATPFAAPYACDLSTTNVEHTGTTYTFSVSSAGAGAMPSCGEMVTRKEVSFGYYECAIRPSAIPGVVTSCQVVSTVKTFYESVYIKFIGNDTRRLYTGYFSNGRSNPTGPVLLNFDASGEDAHRYAFEWTSGYIRWFVDGVVRTSADGGKAIPLTPNRFYVSLLTENPKIETDDSRIFTDASAGRIFLGTEGASTSFTNISYTPVRFIACDNTSGIIPGDNGYKPYDPTNCDMRQPKFIYSDTFAKGWATPDSTTHNLASAGPLRTGTAAISWDFIPLEARLRFISTETFLSSDYDSFNFWIYGNGRFGQQIAVTMLFDDGTPSMAVGINEVLDEGVQPNDWSYASFPFALFGITADVPANVRGFVLSSVSDAYGGQIAIDDVSLGYSLPMCANKTRSVYAEGYAKDFSRKASWGTSSVEKSTDVAHTGSVSYQWAMYQSSGFAIRGKSVQSRDYQGISFWIYTEKLRGQRWTVRPTSPDGGENGGIGFPINLYKYYGGPLPQADGVWTRIIIPLYQFGITTNTKIDGVVFQTTSDDYQGSVYIDDIDLVGQSSKKASGAVSLGAGLVGVILMSAFLLL